MSRAATRLVRALAFVAPRRGGPFGVQCREVGVVCGVVWCGVIA
jgi:hypothetical protein